MRRFARGYVSTLGCNGVCFREGVDIPERERDDIAYDILEVTGHRDRYTLRDLREMCQKDHDQFIFEAEEVYLDWSEGLVQ